MCASTRRCAAWRSKRSTRSRTTRPGLCATCWRVCCPDCTTRPSSGYGACAACAPLQPPPPPASCTCIDRSRFQWLATPASTVGTQQKELIREVEMGPFKHEVDDGLEMRMVGAVGAGGGGHGHGRPRCGWWRLTAARRGRQSRAGPCGAGGVRVHVHAGADVPGARRPAALHGASRCRPARQARHLRTVPRYADPIGPPGQLGRGAK